MRHFAKAKIMLAVAKKLDLTNWQLLEDVKTTAGTCNGIGAEWFPQWLRWAVTKLHPSLEVVSWIHDMEYERGGGVRERIIADFHWLVNGFKAGTKTYSVKQLCRYIVWGQTFLDYVLLRLGGQAAFHWRKNK